MQDWVALHRIPPPAALLVSCVVCRCSTLVTLFCNVCSAPRSLVSISPFVSVFEVSICTKVISYLVSLSVDTCITMFISPLSYKCMDQVRCLDRRIFCFLSLSLSLSYTSFSLSVSLFLALCNFSIDCDSVALVLKCPYRRIHHENKTSIYESIPVDTRRQATFV
ncbi:hypothetical protein CPAR01_05072 [Colletotrichum paranaense]|uniref:Uncharacterized protein n=1 Tax=Colletotrichum paranaense TaxID=1914294 RepID=A0ABQ9SQS9_9PEZI|nr:uncharacterized protein CPAR01_05072 [Colletotrichum paranaense]KAK1541685.1 hypothetical protein CPAR01_05072 [Colletotrichum paranaense]